jgi:hypothetical protein
MDNDTSLRERRLRRAAHARGYRLVRLRRPAPRASHHSGYLLIDAEHDLVVLGGEPEPFSSTLDDVDSFLMDNGKPRRRKRLSPPD